MNAASLIRYFLSKNNLIIKRNKLIKLSKKIGFDVNLGIKLNNTILLKNSYIILPSASHFAQFWRGRSKAILCNTYFAAFSLSMQSEDKQSQDLRFFDSRRRGCIFLATCLPGTFQHRSYYEVHVSTTI